MILSKVSDQVFETAGTIVGCSAFIFILLQIFTELRNKDASTLSPLYVLGFLFIYIFWALYGVRFRRLALWLTNGIAAVLQLLLLAVVLVVK